MSAILTLTTDFGHPSSYVAQMKGVLLSLNPHLNVVDITHAIAPQDIRGAAYLLDDTCPTFPAGTIHVVVVDPGVGTSRAIVYARLGAHHFIAPDNGLLTLLQVRMPPTQLVRISEPRFWREPISATFHGRDIMAPVAAHLSLGVDPAQLGPPLDHLVTLDVPTAQATSQGIAGTVISIDSFGNLITNIAPSLLQAESPQEPVQVYCGGHTIQGIVSTYGNGEPREALALWGSHGRLEIAMVGGNAAQQLQLGVGDEVLVRLPGRREASDSA